LVAHYLAEGMSNKDIAQRLSLSTGQVSKIKNTDIVKAEVHDLQKNAFKKEELVEGKLQSLLPIAIEKIELFLLDPTVKDTIRQDIAFKLLDRVLGKPKQQIETNNTTFKELIEFAKLVNSRKGSELPEMKDVEALVEDLPEDIEDITIDHPGVNDMIKELYSEDEEDEK